MNSGTGFFLTFEGIDGSGKTSQIDLLKEELKTSGISYLLLREPGGTSISEQIRRVLLDNKNAEMTAETELLLFAAARAQLVQEIVKPALAENKVVISDRFYDSTTAYQGFGRDMNVDFIKNLNQYATQNLQPDLTFYFDISVETAFVRLNKRKNKADRLDLESKNFMEKTRQGYLKIAEWYPNRIKVIDAEQPPQAIFQELRTYLNNQIT